MGRRPRRNAKGLGALFAAANDVIPRASSCHGDFRHSGKAKLKDLPAMRMAYLYQGSNVIEGSCNSAQCTMSITHSAGEDAAGTVITFAVSGGKARPASLQCVITP
jgi:hypothetical protein